MLGLLAAALEAGSDALVGHLLGECDLPGWLAAAPIWVTPLPRAGDARHALSDMSHLHLRRVGMGVLKCAVILMTCMLLAPCPAGLAATPV